jgi:transcriptional regulator with XRE-family HTH domain
MESSRLAEVRRCLGLTQKQLAESLKFRTNYIGALECGLRSVSTQFLNRLCLIFPQVNRAYI